MARNSRLQSIKHWLGKEEETSVPSADIFSRLYEDSRLIVFRYLYGLNRISDIPANEVKRVKIGDKNSIHFEGDLVTQDNGKITWNPDPAYKQLYWKENGLWVNLNLSGESALLRNKEDLIFYAESLR